jgi:L-amino acid N-acyltransferase YncA
MAGMEIREATPDDWRSIWPFFEAIVRAGETYAYDTDLGFEAGRAIWMEAPPGRTVVAVSGDDGAVLGSAKMGPNRGGNGAHIATASFMVSPAARGRGVGRALGEHAIAWAADSGYRAMQFNAVVESNRAAVRLWRSLGFEVVGTVPDGFRHPQLGFVGLHVMLRPL